MDKLELYVEKIPGFKLKDSHFRLGSKIHITDFYYAKRFFQNSFFASRVAFIVSKHIVETFNSNGENIENQGLTLIGYGLYSELLLSLIEKFIKARYPKIKMNHDLISDVKTPRLIKNNIENIYKNIKIIVPIGSTLSTAIKIENYLIKNNFDIKFIYPHLNILFVSDSTAANSVHDTSQIEKKFGWKSHENKVVQIEPYDRPSPRQRWNEIVTQNYLLKLPSKWFDTTSCKECFPDDISKERPLNLTDKVSVNPNLIFEDPIGGLKLKNHYQGEINLSHDSLRYGHFVRDDKHYHYYVNIEDFFKENISKVEEWLDNVKKTNEFKDDYKDTDRIIIIAPGHHTNTEFVNLVNDKLFSNSANIIHHDPTTDHIQNFQVFYKKEIKDPDTKIIFVDDTLTTGSTFRRINYYVRLTRDNELGFNSCFFLLNRSDYYSFRNISRKLIGGEKNIFSFSDIDLPHLKEHNEECPLCLEKEKYLEIHKNSFLDRIKIHFLKKYYKLIPEPIYGSHFKKDHQNYYLESHKERYTSRVEAISRIYDWFAKERNSLKGKNYTFEIWLNELLNTTTTPFERHLSIDVLPDDNLTVEASTLLKVLTQPPFSSHKVIRENVFKWVINLLLRQFKLVSRAIENNDFEYHHFDDLKFLYRRAAILNSNILISNESFNVVSQIFSDKGLYKLLHEKVEEIRKLESKNPSTKKDKKHLSSCRYQLNKINEFHIFFASQIKELLYLNEARSIKLQNNLNSLEATTVINHRSFQQLIRILREENAVLIENYWNEISQYEAIHNLINGKEEFSDEVSGRIVRKEFEQKNHRLITLNEFFKVHDEKKAEENQTLKEYLKLKIFLEKERLNNLKNDISLDNKIKYIVEKIKKISFSDTQNIGSFLLVKYKTNRKDSFSIVYNRGEKGYVREADLFESNNFIKEFLNTGYGNPSNLLFTKSIIELKKVNEQWVDMYSVRNNDVIEMLNHSVTPPGCNRLLLIRFNTFIVNKNNGSFDKDLKNKPQGVIGFYFHASDQELTPIKKTRYLLLLRSSVSNFLEKNLNNDSFRDLIEVKNRERTALLTGHGREMLMDLVSNKDYGKDYKKIVSNILLVQRLLLGINEESDFRNIKRSWLFDKVYVERENFINVFDSTRKEINKNYITKLKVLVNNIFKHSEIENSVILDQIEVKFNEAIQFEFPHEILDLICFELFINAKKNRWHFFPEEKIEAEDITYTKNCISINCYVNDNSLFLEISNTGPKVDEDELTTLNSDNNVKGFKTVAGIELIKLLLKSCDLGIIFFDQKPIKNRLYKFTVTLKLNRWNERK